MGSIVQFMQYFGQKEDHKQHVLCKNKIIQDFKFCLKLPCYIEYLHWSCVEYGLPMGVCWGWGLVLKY